MLTQLGDWSEFLHDLDFLEIKHGERLRVFSLGRDGLGNRAKPEKMIQTRVVLSSNWALTASVRPTV